MRLSLLNKVEAAHDDAVWSCAWATPDLLITGEQDALHVLVHHALVSSFLIMQHRL